MSVSAAFCSCRYGVKKIEIYAFFDCSRPAEDDEGVMRYVPAACAEFSGEHVTHR